MTKSALARLLQVLLDDYGMLKSQLARRLGSQEAAGDILQEAYLRLQYRDRLVAALLPDNSGMNLNTMSGREVSEGAVIDLAETLPFFSDRRVIRLDDTGLFDRSAELLPDYMKTLPDYLYLIFTERDVDRRGRMYKAVNKAGRCVEFKEQSGRSLTSWVLKMFSGAGLRIRPSDMELFLSRTGTDMNRIKREADKLVCYCAGRSEITEADIHAVTCVQTESRIFDMVAAVTGHRLREAMELYKDLLSLKEPPLRILYLIGREYHRLLIVKEMLEEGCSDQQIAQKAGMPPFAVRKSRSLLSRYTRERLLAAVRTCTEAEEAVKTGTLAEGLAVELILSVLGGP